MIHITICIIYKLLNTYKSIYKYLDLGIATSDKSHNEDIYICN